MMHIPDSFRNANYEFVPYDGSPVSWRISIYGIHIVDEELLIIKQINEKYWDIPGGGIEIGESLDEALVRESAEEAGWKLEPTQSVTTILNWLYHEGEKKYYRTVQMYWLATGEKLITGPTEAKTLAVERVPLKELLKYPLYPNVLTALEKLKLL